MNIKNFLRTALVILIIGVTSPAISSPFIAPVEITAEAPMRSTEVLLARLTEIKEMNKENLTRSEKKQLRTEVKEIKKEMKANRNGVYLSVGAIVIIVLLLIILL